MPNYTQFALRWDTWITMGTEHTYLQSTRTSERPKRSKSSKSMKNPAFFEIAQNINITDLPVLNLSSVVMNLKI